MPTKISSIDISNFTVFEHNEIKFSPGLNVFIGKNGSGKTHLLKVLYSVLKSKSLMSSLSTMGGIDSQVSHVFNETFKTEVSSNLIRNASKKVSSNIMAGLSNSDFVKLTLYSGTRWESETSGHHYFPECLYIPPQEMLSLFDGFIASWEKRENSFDETYYQMAKALSLSPLKDESAFAEITKPLEKILNAKITRQGGKFYLEYVWGKIEMHLAAEGLRKLASIIYLIANGSINEKTIIFWDEPEVHFNPSLIEALVTLIKGLTDKGIQIFITTHDYLLSQRLSLIAEYESPKFPIKFFCLSNEKDKGVEIEEGTTLADIESNPILNEFAHYYDFERDAFKHSIKEK